MKRNQQDFRTEKYIRYGIRKYSFGAASVAIAAGLMFLGTGAVAAAETQSEQNTDTALVAPAHTSNQLESEKEEVSPVSDDTHAPVDKEAVTGTAPIKEDKKQTVTPATEESTKPQEAEKREDVKPSTVQEVETKEDTKAEVSHSIENKDVKETSLKSEENPSLNLSSLKEKLAGLESQIERIQGNAKQAAHISNAEKLASEAKRFLESLDTTQKEVDAKAKEISSFTSILKSIKAEETPKENKNQDSRNDKKMEEGTGFRAGEAATTPPTTTGVGADVVDATATPAVEKTSFTDKEAAKAISKQIAWLDFGDVANWTNLGSGSRLKVGSTYTKEVMPGYHVTIKVKSLKPFQATEIYRKRMEAMGATDEEKATFDPNATNGLLHIDGLAEVSATDQGDYSEIKKAGIIDAGTRKVSIGSTRDGANIGVQFEISGTYKGRTVRPSVVMLDSESNDFGENIIFTTNGRGWEKVLEINKNVSNPKGYVPINNFESPKNLAAIGRYQPGVLGPRTSETAVNIVKVGSGKIAAKYLTNPDRVTGGLGTGVFGPVATAVEFSIPVVMTRDASEVGLYILTGGQQRSMMGIAPIDEGDAPESYGGAFHMISTKNGLTGAEVNQPYLGSERPDMDTNNTKDWLGDDKSPEANNDPHADEGINQILPDNLKNVDRQIIKLDRTNTNGHYTYSLDIQAHTDGAPQAHIYGWIDFNNNGKFDEDERSELATITNDSTVTLHFNRSFTEVDPKLVELGTRVRIATNAKEIEKPTGVAFSGEVEDFKTQITHPPRGEQVRTEDRPRITQSGHITFTARGKVAYKVTEDAEIRTDIPPVYIDNKTGHPITLPADGIYTVAGQGTYKITLAANNKDVDVQFTPEDGFLGEAHGITIRRQDTNDATTGWINRNTNTSMDGLYIPKVVVTGKSENASSINLQGLSQSGTPVFRGEWNNNPATPTATNPAKLVDPRTNEVTGATTVDALDSNNNKIGTYTIKPLTGEVTFTPKKDFTGTPIPAIVSLDLVDGHDKDGQPATTLIRATYSPTVIPITPQAEASTTSGVQGKPQTSPISLNTPDIETNTVNFNKGSQEGPNGESVELDATTLTLLDGDGHEVTSVTIPQQGKYELNKTNKTITFTPNKDFVGPATPVKVQIKDVNGTKVETTYTPTVTDVTMESKDKTSEAPQGKTQTGTPEFKVSDPNVQISGYKLVDPVTKTPVDSTEIEVPNEGTYKIDKTSGQVTFIPKPEFKGPATGITVQATDENGEIKDATYKPTVTPIEVTPGDKTTKDIQGVPQSETPTFTIPDGVTNESITSRKLVDPTNNQPTDSVTLEGKGTFTINGNGKVTFTPVPSYIGDVPAVKVEATITVTNEKNESTTITSTANYKPVIVPVEIEKTPAESTNLQGLEQTGRPTFTPQTVTVNGEQKTVSIKPNSYKLVKDGVEVPTTPAYKQGTTEEIGTYTINASTGEVTFTPIDKTYTGPVEPAVVQATGSNGSKVNTTYTPSITPVSPTAEKSATSGVQGKPQTSSIVLDTKETGDDKGTTVNFNKGTEEGPNGERVNLDPATLTLLDSSNTPVDSVTTPQGKYELNKANKTITFTPNKDFVGPATPVKVQIKDVNGTKVETTYTPTVTDVTMESKDKTSEAPQGKTQTGTPEFKVSDPNVQISGYKLVDPVTKTPVDSTEIEVPNEGTYKIDKTSGQVTFIPKPEFKGPATGITVQATDENGEIKDATYKPTVTPIEVTPGDKTTKDIQGVPQSETPTFTIPDGVTNESITSRKLVDPTNNQPTDSVTLEGKGTFRIDGNGKVTFTPEPAYTGDVPSITVKATITVTNDKGESATIDSEAHYKPVIVPLELEKAPVTTRNLQGLEQKGTPTFTPKTIEVDGVQKTVSIEPGSYKLVKDGVEVPTTPAYKQGTTEEIGTYTINASTGEVTFTPIDKTYTGPVEPAVVQATGSNGSKVNTTYTPSITPVSPTAEKSATSGVQGKPQTSSIVLDTKETGDDKGTTVNFNKGTEEGPNGERVNLDPATLTLLDSSNTPVDSVTTPQGKYELNKANKTITFTPNKDFVGPATPVKVQIKDVNGTKVETTYTPTVEEVTPTGKDSATTGPQGVAQTSPIVFNQKDEEDGKTVNFDTGHELVAFKQDTLTLINGNGEKVTTITVPEVGTYELKDGAITFTPVKTFKGTTEGVTIQIEDENGKVVTKKYVPTVEEVTPTGENSETEGPKAQPQTSTIVFDKKDVDNSTVNFNKGHELVALDPTTITLVGRDGSPATEVTISGEGTYTLANNIITFTPESDFAGKATGVTVQVKDANGTVVAKTYTPTVRPITEFKDKEGNTIPGSVTEDGRTEKKDFPEYRFIETKVDEKGNTKHIYEKVSTFFKDKEGNELPNTPSEKGTVEKKEVPEYRFVETKKLPNGDTEHVYEKVSTFFKDKEGNELPNTPSEKGTVEKKEVPEYRFVETKKLPNGDTEHVYEKVSTFFKDKEGNELPNTPSEKGTVEKKEVPEYRFVETKKLPNGDTEHVYEKVSTFFKDKEGNELPNTPSEKGTVEKKEVPEYRFVETKKLPNGDTEHVYEKVSTFFKDKEGNELPNTPSEKGTVEKKEVPEYRFVETKKDEKGNTIHVYQKVSTTYVDEEGKEINPSDKGTKGNKEIPDYIFKETKKDEKGNTIHVYQKVSTTYVDEEGKEINPSDRGTKANKDISGYTFKETKKDEKGNTIHIYTKKSSSTPIKEQGQSTIWKDVDGNVIKSRENGKKEHSAIEGYVFDHSELDINGNTVHIYRKVSEKETSYVDENGKSLQISKKGQHPQESISGYEFVRTETDANGNVRNIYRKIPTSTTGLASTSEQSVQSSTEVKNELPNTGTETNASLATLGLLGLLSGFGLVARKKKED